MMRSPDTINRALHALAGAILFAVPFMATPARASCAALGVVVCSATATATSLPFGDYNPSSNAPRDISSSVTVTATAIGVGLFTTIGYSISLNEGANGSLAARKMVGGSAATPLAYNLFTSSNYDQVWGADSVSDTVGVLATVLGTSLTRSYAVYGRIAPNQYVSTGAYADTIIVTVTY